MDQQKNNDDSELFLKYNYPETKDMCKQFLTLISAILVTSLTFSEKIVNFNSSSIITKWLIISAWILLLISIIFCGIGLLLITVAAGDAVYVQNKFLRIAHKSYISIVASGICFVTGLLLLILTAIASIHSKENKLVSPSIKTSSARLDRYSKYYNSHIHGVWCFSATTS